TIEFWSVDVAGNIEVHKTASFTVTAPDPATVGQTRTKVTIRTREGSVHRSRRLTLSGTLTPATGGEAVSVYVMAPGSTTWELLAVREATVTSNRVESDDDSSESRAVTTAVAKWSYGFASNVRGTYRLQARFAGDDDSAASVSRTIRIVVR
ncbi:MAG: hypothetical protein CVT67_04510, partial [Actinobacteria bacterium HGW-Actinobacteria-7]